MSLKDKLMLDYKNSMKNRDSVRKSTINMVRAAIKQYEVDNREELDEEGILDVISKQVKMRRDALEDFRSAGRDDLADEYQAEIDILVDYLPEQLSADEIENIITEAIAQVNADGKKDMGKVMGAVMPKVKGLADGNLVKNLVQKILK